MKMQGKKELSSSAKHFVEDYKDKWDTLNIKQHVFKYRQDVPHLDLKYDSRCLNCGIRYERSMFSVCKKSNKK
jgi:hypothetical protein